MSRSSGRRNQVVVITGAASGLGKGLALELAQAGMKVVISDIDERGLRVANAINDNGGAAVFVKTDLANEEDISRMMSEAFDRFGCINILVNNAKPKLGALPFEESLDDWDSVAKILLKAPALTVKYALQYFDRSGGGDVVNISSTNSRYISHQPAVYHVCKAGLIQLTRYLACTLAERKIRVNAICPALIDISDDGRKPLTDNPVNKTVVELSVPLRRAATVADIAHTILFLSSVKASYMTGQVMILDGGITLRDHFDVARTAFLKGAEGD